MPNSFGPGDFSLPIDLNHCGPLSRPMMCGTQQSVSTLLITVGRANAPAIAGNGGLLRGQPRLPSSASSNPVSSPQMYAPAPRCTKHSSLYFEPKIPPFPNTPCAYASLSAC